jgi:hypothetical protein
MDRCRASYHLLIILAENPRQLILLIEGISALQMENAMLHGVQGVWLFHTCDTLAEVLSRETSQARNGQREYGSSYRNPQ